MKFIAKSYTRLLQTSEFVKRLHFLHSM